MPYVYMVRCADGSYYSGSAADLEKRVAKHNSGAGAKYTRSRLPVELVYYEECGSTSEALKKEHALKKLSHSGKEALAGSFAGTVSRVFYD